MKKFMFCLFFLSSFLVFSQVVFSASDLPVPGDGGVQKPSGTAGNLVVLDWAGFKSAVSYTFDDGQPSHIQHYNELEATGVNMTFYISSNVNWIPNSDQVWSQAVRDGHEIGNHTASHPYSDLSGGSFGTTLSSQEAEIDTCTDYIIQHTGQTDVWTMAAPYGDEGWKTAAMNNFFLNRRVGGGTIAPDDNTDPFLLPCYMANSGETASTFNYQIDSANSRGEWLILLLHTINPTSDNWYAPVDINQITGSIDHAKSLGNVWIDSVVNIGSYWRGQKLFNSITPATSGQDTVWTWTLPTHFPPGKYLRVKVDGGTLKQGGQVLQWDSHGYYEVSLDAGSLTLSPASDILTGDVNNDSSINSLDYTMLRRYILGTYNNITFENADMNQDGSVNSIDYALLKGYLLE